MVMGFAKHKWIVGVALTIAIAQGASSQTAVQPLQGGVQKVHLSLADLNTVGLDLKNVLKAATSLYDEVTIQPVTIVTEPEVVGRGMVVNIPVATTAVGPPTPARKDRVDLAMSHVKPTVDMLKSNVDQFVAGQKQVDLPADIMTTLQPQFADWVKTVDTLAAQEAQLEQLTAKGPPYDQPSIASQCVAVECSIKELDKTRHQVYKVLRKHAKELSASNSGSN